MSAGAGRSYETWSEVQWSDANPHRMARHRNRKKPGAGHSVRVGVQWKRCTPTLTEWHNTRNRKKRHGHPHRMAQRQKREKTTTTETGKNQELAIPRGLACSENVAVVSRNRSNVSNSSNNGSLYLRQRTPLEKFGKKFNSRKRPGSEK